MKTTPSLPTVIDYSSVDVKTLLVPWHKRYWADGKRCCPPDLSAATPMWNDADSRRPISGAWKTVVFLTYENPGGASGGIVEVIRRLPAELAKRFLTRADGSKVSRQFVRLSPLHTKLKSSYTAEDLRQTIVASCPVEFGAEKVNVTVYKVTEKRKDPLEQDMEWYLFGAKGFFEADGGLGGKDPYTYGSETQVQRDGDDSCLLRDSLFAAKAVPAVLKALNLTKDVIIHAQDWEFACAALTVKSALADGTLESAAVVLTLHNPYDHFVSANKLAQITRYASDSHWPALGGIKRETVLTRMIPLLDAPVSTVSHQFARELTSASIQTAVFAGHMQPVLKHQGLVGIDNGNFGKAGAAPSFSLGAIAAAKRGAVNAIVNEKRAKRKLMLHALAEYQRSIDPKRPESWTEGTLTGIDDGDLEDLPEEVPVFMMVGRLDPGQKGYDICAQLIRSLPVGSARFVLTPMSPLARDATVAPYFQQLKDLATDRPGEVVVFAHRMAKAYKETMAGATYGLWPSRYEPFGGVNEFYACGTPVIAHAVGGLVQQVVDYNAAPTEATGFVYHDIPPGIFQKELEEEFVAAHTALPEDRLAIPEYVSECELLESAVHHAIDIFKYAPEAYGRMLANLSGALSRLGWSKPVNDYLEWYDTACR